MYLDTPDKTVIHRPGSLGFCSPRAPAQLQGPHVMSRLTGSAWDACDELELEDVATADGVNMIMNTLAEAFQGE